MFRRSAFLCLTLLRLQEVRMAYEVRMSRLSCPFYTHSLQSARARTPIRLAP
jgi:hypothetical protein